MSHNGVILSHNGVILSHNGVILSHKKATPYIEKNKEII